MILPIKSENISSFYTTKFKNTFKLPNTITKQVKNILNLNNFDKRSILNQIFDKIYIGNSKSIYLVDYDAETDEYKCYDIVEFNEDKKNKNVYYVKFELISEYIKRQNIEQIKELILSNIIIGSCCYEDSKYKIITGFNPSYIEQSIITDEGILDANDKYYNNEEFHTSFFDEDTRMVNTQYIEYLENLKDDDEIDFEVRTKLKLTKYKFETLQSISCDKILKKYFDTYLSIFVGKEIKYKEGDDNLYTNDTILELKYLTTIEKNKDGFFIKYGSKLKIPVRKVITVDLDFVFTILSDLITDGFFEYFKIDRNYLSKFKLENKEIVETIQEENKDDEIINKINAGESAYFEYMMDIPDEIMLDIVNNQLDDDDKIDELDDDVVSDIVGNVNCHYDDFEPYDWESDDDGNDSEYFYRIYSLEGGKYTLSIRTSSYIKDQLICDPRGVSQFEISKK